MDFRPGRVYPVKPNRKIKIVFEYPNGHTQMMECTPVEAADFFLAIAAGYELHEIKEGACSTPSDSPDTASGSAKPNSAPADSSTR